MKGRALFCSRSENKSSLTKVSLSRVCECVCACVLWRGGGVAVTGGQAVTQRAVGAAPPRAAGSCFLPGAGPE